MSRSPGKAGINKTTIYEEDTPTRYLRIKKGDPGVVSFGGVRLPHRKDSENLRSVEGDLALVFREMYGSDHPKLVVETKNEHGYEVAYNPDDPKAMEGIAKQFCMTIGEDEREILALRITISKGGHHLKQVAKPNATQWNSSEKEVTPAGAAERHYAYPLHGVTMDELALFLERRYCRPVVNMTGLTGYYWLEVSGESARLWPQKMNEVKQLDQTGLELHWESTKVRVLVVKDKK